MLGGQCLTQNSFPSREVARSLVGLLGGSGSMLSQKIFKIKCPRLAKNAFPEMNHESAARSLALKFERFKKLFAGFGGAIPPLPPVSYSPDIIESLPRLPRTLRVFYVTSTLSWLSGHRAGTVFFNSARYCSLSRHLSCTSLKENCNTKNMLISSERPFKILQNENKILKIRWAAELFNVKDHDLDSFLRKNYRKPKMFLEVL